MALIYSITPFTMLDYPDKLACIVWFSGCNMRCIYCYNTEIVKSSGVIENSEFLHFLDGRIDKLEAVVFSGGECTLNKDFLYLAKEVKKRNFSLKIDTNGSNLENLKKAIKLNLIDYIALDFKALKENYFLVTNSNLYEKFIKTLKYLISLNFPFEVRTTIHADIFTENDISKMAEMLEKFGYKGIYYLQNFLETGENFGVLQNPTNSFDPKKIKSNLKIELRNF
ncbi:anaerobic ribonucleoside-triphosphate reductase activating protein [Campylobacter ureolyticus]